MRISTGYSVPYGVTERPFRIIDGVANRREDAEAAASQNARNVSKPTAKSSEQDSTSQQHENENGSQNSRTLRFINAASSASEITSSARKALQTYMQTEQHADTPSNLLSRLDLYV